MMPAAKKEEPSHEWLAQQWAIYNANRKGNA
jgi:hypothetical protein